MTRRFNLWRAPFNLVGRRIALWGSAPVDGEQHERVTGVVDNSRVLAFGERLARLKRPMWLRFVLVPGLTDVPDEMARLAEYAAGLGVVERVEVLPFHQMGAFKWANLGLDYSLEATQPPSPEQVEAAIGVFRAAGLNAC